LNRALKFGGILLAAVAASVSAVEPAAVAIGHADVRELPDHRKIDLAAAFVAGNGERTERGSVITLLPTQNLVPASLTDLDLILAGQLQRCLNRFRSAGGEVNGSAFKVSPRESKQLLCVFLGDGRGELAGMDEF